MRAGQEMLLVRWSQVSSALAAAEAALSGAAQEAADGESDKALRLRVLQLQRDAQRTREAIAAARAEAGRNEDRRVG